MKPSICLGQLAMQLLQSTQHAVKWHDLSPSIGRWSPTPEQVGESNKAPPCHAIGLMTVMQNVIMGKIG